MCESCPMLGSHKNTGFSQIVGVDSVFVGFVTQLCQMCVCVCGAWTHVCIHKADFSTTLQIMPMHTRVKSANTRTLLQGIEMADDHDDRRKSRGYRTGVLPVRYTDRLQTDRLDRLINGRAG